MLQKKSFVKKTRGGKILKTVREHYLRDDIPSGTPLDPACDAAAHTLSATAPHYLVIDTNIALHQMDFLEHPAVNDVIVCRTVVEEVEHRNKAGAQRLKALCEGGHKRVYVFSNEHHRDTYVKELPNESPNDRNDRAIRVAARWYAERLAAAGASMPVILLTNDAGNRAEAAKLGVPGLTALSLPAYAAARAADAPELRDLVARQELADDDEVVMMAVDGGARGGPAGPGPGSSGGGAAGGAAPAGGGGGGGGGGSSKRKRLLYEPHKPAAELAAGVAAGRYHQGSLRCSRFNPFEGWVSSAAAGCDILVSGRTDMNRAVDGDVVVVELLPEAQWKGPSRRLAPDAAGGGSSGSPGEDGGGEGGAAAAAGDDDGGDAIRMAPGIFDPEAGPDLDGPPPPPAAAAAAGGKAAAAGGGAARPTGRVVGVAKRGWRARGYCGSLQATADPPAGGGTASVLVVPVDRRFPLIRIQTRQAKELMDKRVVVALDAWEPDSAYPAGHYVRTLGVIGERQTETDVLLVENDINTAPFTPAVQACVPPLPWAVTEADVADPTREDLRHLPVCSVDPPGCKDIDDALHVRELPNGNYELGVHIADVTHFVLPGTAMDLEAAARATTTYLVDARIDMLPKALTEDICSLRGGVERLAFSAIWEVTPSADVVSVRFAKSVIASRAALTYQQAQERIDDARLGDEVTLGLRAMMRLAKQLRARRVAAGALQLASPEVKFKLDERTQEATDLGMYQLRDTNSMVEEMMLLANVSVAEAIVKRFPGCSLLRRHQTPEPRQFEPLLTAAAAAGFALDVATSKALAESLDGAVRPGDAYFNTLVRIMATRCMTQARYFGSGDCAPAEFYHYGLASPIYTHFTSPIRRYADVVVHRLLAAAIGLAPLPDSARDADALRDCAANLNARHHNAQTAGRASVGLFTLLWFAGRPPAVADARVLKVKADGLVVFVPRYGIEGPVFLTPKAEAGAGGGGGKDAPSSSSSAAPAFVLDEERQRVVAADGSASYAVFDRVAVRVGVREGRAHRRELALELVPRSELAPEDVVP